MLSTYQDSSLALRMTESAGRLHASDVCCLSSFVFRLSSIIYRLTLFSPRKKLLIRPMLMRGRAQAFSFDESARSSRLSGISVSSRKNWYSHLPPGCLAGHLQEFLQVVFDASESSDSYEEVLPASMACPLIRCVHVTGKEAGAPSGPFQFSLSI